MSGSGKQAVLILFDNSVTSLDGDFPPNRLVAQRESVEDISRFYLRQNQESLVGFGTLAQPDYGIATALTRDQRRIRAGLDNVNRGTLVALEKSLRCAMIALRHKPADIPEKKIVVLLGSIHELTQSTTDELIQFTNKEGVSVDIIVFSSDTLNVDLLEKYCSSLIKPSQFFLITNTNNLRSAMDKIFLPGSVIEQEEIPGLAETLRLSQQEAGIGEYDDEFQRALQASMFETIRPLPANPEDIDETDPSIQEALALSKAVVQDEDIDMDDPELLYALQMSMKETNPEKNDDTQSLKDNLAASLKETHDSAPPSPSKSRASVQAESSAPIEQLLTQLLEKDNNKPSPSPKDSETTKARAKELADKVKTVINDRGQLASVLDEYGISIEEFDKLGK